MSAAVASTVSTESVNADPDTVANGDEMPALTRTVAASRSSSDEICSDVWLAVPSRISVATKPARPGLSAGS